MNRTGYRAAVFGTALTAACSATDLFTGAHDEPALIVFYGDTTRLTAPDIVANGTRLDISFTTFGGGCTRAIARDDIAATETGVDIRPYDRASGSQICTADLLFLKHAVTIQATKPGPLVVRLLGEQRGAGTGGQNQPAEVSRTILVR